MSARRVATMLIACVVAACGATAETASPSPSVASAAVPAITQLPTPSAAATPTARPSPSAGGEIRVPLESGVFPANADGEALIVTRRLIDGRTTRVEAIDLKTGALSAVHETLDAAVTVPSIRDGVVTLLETAETPTPMEFRMRVLAGRWRDPSSFRTLDEFNVAFAGGDSWNPYPDPQTNGWEVAWMHTADGTYELRIRDADGNVRTAYSSTTPFSFALARSGDVAIGDITLAGRSAPVALRLASAGAVRTLLERAANGSGDVLWQNGALLWTNGLGLVVPMSSVERIVPATLERAPVAIPPGCAFTGATDAQVAFACADHVELTGGPGPARIGPPLPLLHARAIIRTDQGPPPIAYVTPVVLDDPRPGPGARF